LAGALQSRQSFVAASRTAAVEWAHAGSVRLETRRRPAHL